MGALSVAALAACRTAGAIVMQAILRQIVSEKFIRQTLISLGRYLVKKTKTPIDNQIWLMLEKEIQKGL